MVKPDLSEFVRVKKCVVGSLELSEEQREKFEYAMKQPNSLIMTSDIEKVLKNWGFSIKRTSLSVHRRGACCCKNN